MTQSARQAFLRASTTWNLQNRRYLRSSPGKLDPQRAGDLTRASREGQATAEKPLPQPQVSLRTPYPVEPKHVCSPSRRLVPRPPSHLDRGRMSGDGGRVARAVPRPYIPFHIAETGISGIRAFYAGNDAITRREKALRAETGTGKFVAMMYWCCGLTVGASWFSARPEHPAMTKASWWLSASLPVRPEAACELGDVNRRRWALGNLAPSYGPPLFQREQPPARRCCLVDSPCSSGIRQRARIRRRGAPELRRTDIPRRVSNTMA